MKEKLAKFMMFFFLVCIGAVVVVGYEGKREKDAYRVATGTGLAGQASNPREELRIVSHHPGNSRCVWRRRPTPVFLLAQDIHCRRTAEYTGESGSVDSFPAVR